MSTVFKSSIVLALFAISIYLFWSLSEDVIFAPPQPETPIAPLAAAARPDVDEELDFRIAQRIGSLEIWRAFLNAHASGPHAQLARAEVEKLLDAKNTRAEASNGASPDARASSEVAHLAAPSQATPSTPDEICKRDEERLERLRSSPSSEEAARFAAELRCETLRPQLLGLMETLGSSAPAPARSEVSNGASPDAKATSEVARVATPSPATEVAPSTPDEICKRDEERLERLRNSPSSEEAARFADELRCETLRPQLLRLLESQGFVASPSASASESPSVKGRSAVGLKAASDCVSEQDSLNRIRAQPSADTAQQLWRNLQCERLRPQVRLLLESLNLAADPPGACWREAEELNRIRTNPNRREAEGFVRDMTCDALKPQAARLLESLIE